MNLRAYEGHVLARIIRGPEETESGLRLPESHRSVDAIVVSVGPGVAGLAPSDRIFYKQTAAHVGHAVVARETSVWVDQAAGIIAVHAGQIGATMDNGEYRGYGRHLICEMIFDDVTKSALVLPESMLRKKGWARVLHIGPDVSGPVAVGDEIVFKDSAVYVGGNIVTQESAIILDKAKHIVAVLDRQIIAARTPGQQDAVELGSVVVDVQTIGGVQQVS